MKNLYLLLAIIIMAVSAKGQTVSGTYTVCVGGMETLSVSPAGGTWSSSSPSVASVWAGDVYLGESAGTATLTYTTGTGSVTVTVTVNQVVAPITGTPLVCVGGTTSMACADPGGIWNSADVITATVSSSGVVNGNYEGIDQINYFLPSGCYNSVQVTVNATPAAITGPDVICMGSGGAQACATPGGTWSSSNPSIPIVAATGIVTAITPGTSNITYTLGTGCYATRTITVTTVPPITGPSSVCMGSTATLLCGMTGGSWISAAPSIASIGPATGVIVGVSPGTVNITYALPMTGCVSLRTLTVNAAPSAITGPDLICMGSTGTQSCTTPGGTWTSSNVSIPIGSGTGIVTALAPGTSNITYTVGAGCYTTRQITVNNLPDAIGGSSNVCAGSSVSLSCSTPGGSWSLDGATIASIGTSSGVATGIATGTTNISYTMAGVACRSTMVLTVFPTPMPIVGPGTTCQGSTITLSSMSTGGTWSSGTPAVATIGTATGVVTGLTFGTSIISYTLGYGCYATKTITVYPLPAAITGTAMACPGSTTTLSSGTSGGAWSSDNTAIASIDAGGVVSGVAPGTANISYTTTSTGCSTMRQVTVNPNPAPISGPGTVCVGSTVTMSSATGGGTWSFSDPSIASVMPGGCYGGLSPGTGTITYTIPTTGCFVVASFAVTATAPAITGPDAVCLGATTTFSNTTTGGSWTSDNATVLAISPATGVAYAVGPGSATITYTLPGGCSATKIVSVTPLPPAITGPLTVCTGLCGTLSNASPGGTWSISPTSTATIVAGTGVYCGVSAGTAIVTYTTGCSTTAVITVNPLPAAIIGSLAICPGTTTTLTNATSGGSWSSGNMSVATIGSSDGVVTGVSAGLSAITYTIPTGCIRTAQLTVNPNPGPITGSGSVCVGGTASVSCTPAGGTWSTSDASMAVISSGGTVTGGIVDGVLTITYTRTSSGCYSTGLFTVNPSPSAITGPASVCVGGTITESCTPAGGAWNTGSVVIATVNTSGVVTGNSAAPVTLTYTLSTGCRTSRIITVNALPGAITGTATVCEGLNTTLSCTPLGGSWTSSDPSTATVTTSFGVVTGVANGTTTVTYTISTGCYNTKVVTVNPAPGTITGPDEVCAGSTITLSTATTGGAWISGSTGIAAVNPSTGVVTGVATGVANITYMVSSGCYTTKNTTVNASPAAITGPSAICDGTAATMSCTTSGGTWSSNIPFVAAISSTGVVTGVTSGVTTISYIVSSSCYSTKSLTVNPFPAAITGTAVMCESATTVLSSASPGGTWFSANPAVATIGTTTGIVTTYTAGVNTISYTLGTGCFTTVEITVNPMPATITGPGAVCEGSTVTQSSSTTGGIWTSSNTAVASIDVLTGIVTGHAAGVVTISYTLGTGCSTMRSFTVNELPAAITGPSAVCIGGSASEYSASPGGAWSSSAIAVATIDAAGTVASVSPGTTTISYTLSTGCATTRIFTVHALPSAITGTPSVCMAATTTLSNTTTGGTWSSTATTIATIDAAGVVTGVAAGTTTISYELGTGCSVTRIVTVNPPPASITGPSAVCVGSTMTLGCTPAGGTWSSYDPTVAMVAPTSGVVSGLVAGTTIITYATGSMCYNTSIITVNSTPAAITGPTMVCEGSMTTLSCATSGGTWLSTTTTTAEIGSATGIVTGVSAGTTIITYYLVTDCISTLAITTNATPAVTASAAPASCGPLYAATAVGATTYSWAPATGIVSGATSDVAYIYADAPLTYTVTGTTAGCSGTGTITISANRILGHISFSGVAPSGTDAKVWLVQYNTVDSSIIATDSLLTCLDGGDPYYEFNGKPAGNYLVKAKLLSSVTGTSDYIPTYGASSATWDLATGITHAAASDSQHIDMIYGTVPSGPGFISGFVYMGAGKGTAADVPVANMVIYLQNDLGQVLTYTYTDVSGAYTFSGVAAGSYRIYPEEMSYNTIPALVTVSAGVPADGIGFKKHTTTGIIDPWSMPNINAAAATVNGNISVYPNPALDNIVIAHAKGMQVTITDVLGKEIYNELIANDNQNVSLTGIASGVYMVTAQDHNGHTERFRVVKE